MESKKLRLSNDKCYKIHIYKIHIDKILKVHDADMKNVTKATYLGDVINESGTIDKTILQRSKKATGINTQISAMLSSISLGRYHYDIALVIIWN